jgi:hypothetical protein
VGGQLYIPAALPPGKQPVTHLIGGWVGPRASLDTAVRRKFPAPAGTRTPQSSSPQLSTIPLSYPGSWNPLLMFLNLTSSLQQLSVHDFIHKDNMPSYYSLFFIPENSLIKNGVLPVVCQFCELHAKNI